MRRRGNLLAEFEMGRSHAVPHEADDGGWEPLWAHSTIPSQGGIEHHAFSQEARRRSFPTFENREIKMSGGLELPNWSMGLSNGPPNSCPAY